MGAIGSLEASCVPEEALVSHCLQILQLLLESCRPEQLELLAELLNLKGDHGLGAHFYTLIDNESVNSGVKFSCLSLLGVMVSCKEFRLAVCPEIGDDEDLDGKSVSVCSVQPGSREIRAD